MIKPTHPQWNKKTVLEWFKTHEGQAIRISKKGTMLNLSGCLKDLESVDACSAEIEQATITMDFPDLECSLSLHEDALAVQVVGTKKDQVLFLLPLHITYDQLEVETLEGSEVEDEASPSFSPYELLH